MWRHVLLRAGICAWWLASAAPAPCAGAPEANEAGVELFRAGRLREAAAKFDEALALDAGGAEIRHNLAAALAALGHQELQAGRLEEARELSPLLQGSSCL